MIVAAVTAPVAAEVTGLVLAGGRGSRMGHVDKGLQLLAGYPLVMHVLMRLAPQVGPVLVNANQNLQVYGDLGHPVVPDDLSGFAGPLAGLAAGLARCETPYLLSVPCDSPFLPGDLCTRLGQAMIGAGADLATVCTGSQAHPVFALMRTDVRADLSRFLAEGGRKIDAWTARLKTVLVDFADEADAFLNINTIEELRAHERR